MSLFRASTERIDEISIKVLVYGPQGAGKSHFAHSAPEPAVIDFEHRSGSFRTQFTFQEVAPTSFREGVEAIREIASGKVRCKSVVADSLTKPYQSVEKRFTTESTNDSGRVSSVVDWPAVNRTMRTLTDPLLAIPDKNIISIARQNVRLERSGRDFKSAGVKMVGDEKSWAFDYDYVLHFSGRGTIHVEKSMSVHIPADTNIRGDMDWDRFIRLIVGEEPIEQSLRVAGGRA